MSSIAAFSRTQDVGIGKGIFALDDVDIDSLPTHDEFFSDHPPKAASSGSMSSASAQDFDFVNVDLSAAARKGSVFGATHNAFFSKSSDNFFRPNQEPTAAAATPEPAPALRRKTRNRANTTRGDGPGMQRSTSSHNLRSSFKRQQAMAGSRSAHASPATSPAGSPTSSPPSSPTVGRADPVPFVVVPPTSPTSQPRIPARRARSFTIGTGATSTTVSAGGANIPKIVEGRQRRPKKVLEAVSTDRRKRESLMAMTLDELQAHLKELRAQLAEQNAVMLEMLESREELTCDKEILSERLDFLKETPTPGGLTVPY